MTLNKEKAIKFLLECLDNEITELIYTEPKCDFEHIWNSAIDKALEVIDSWKKDDDELEINWDKFKPTVEFGEETKKT